MTNMNAHIPVTSNECGLSPFVNSRAPLTYVSSQLVAIGRGYENVSVVLEIALGAAIELRALRDSHR